MIKMNLDSSSKNDGRFGAEDIINVIIQDYFKFVFKGL